MKNQTPNRNQTISHYIADFTGYNIEFVRKVRNKKSRNFLVSLSNAIVQKHLEQAKKEIQQEKLLLLLNGKYVPGTIDPCELDG